MPRNLQGSGVIIRFITGFVTDQCLVRSHRDQASFPIHDVDGRVLFAASLASKGPQVHAVALP